MSPQQAVIGVVSLLPAFINSIEAVFGKQPGTDKKAAVLGLVQNSLEAFGYIAPKVAASAAPMMPGIGTAIDGIVTAFNAAGHFTKVTATAQPGQ